MLELQQIEKRFDGLQLLAGVSFSLLPETITCISGENGSGKTTLMHIITGFLKADGGSIRLNGSTITQGNPVEIARYGIGKVWQNPRLFRNLSILDNLILSGRNHPGENLVNYLLHFKRVAKTERLLKERAIQIAGEFRLAGKLEKIAGVLSFGEQKLLSIGMLLMNEAEVLVLDEPFAGVNPLMINHISEVMCNLKKQGKTIFMAEHNIAMAEAISDRVLKLTKGKIFEQVTK